MGTPTYPYYFFTFFKGGDSMRTRCYDGKNGNTNSNTKGNVIVRKDLERNVRQIQQV